MKTENEPAAPDVKFTKWRTIDLDSPWFMGVGRDMTDDERLKAEAHGGFDNAPMSILGIVDGLAAVDGHDAARMVAAAPAMFEALERVLPHLKASATALIGQANEAESAERCVALLVRHDEVAELHGEITKILAAVKLLERRQKPEPVAPRSLVAKPPVDGSRRRRVSRVRPGCAGFDCPHFLH